MTIYIQRGMVLHMGIRNAIDSMLYYGYERLLTSEIKEFRVPEHIAIIMDGNRRFAFKTGMPTYQGHFQGANTTENVLDWSFEIGIKQLTLYAFSTENLNRSEAEKNNIFELIGLKLEELINDDRTHQRKMRVRILGHLDLLPLPLQQIARQVEHVTKHYDNCYLNIAMAYGGRQEIVDAARIIAQKIKNRELALSHIDEHVISNHLYPSDSLAVPDVDLIIRTGGDERISNFLPWQANGNECAAYFCAPYWPEFRKIDLLRSIRTYQTREYERQKNTVLRIVKLLSSTGYVEVEQVITMSQRAADITSDEVLSILKELSGSREMKHVALIW